MYIFYIIFCLLLITIVYVDKWEYNNFLPHLSDETHTPVEFLKSPASQAHPGLHLQSGFTSVTEHDLAQLAQSLYISWVGHIISEIGSIMWKRYIPDVIKVVLLVYGLQY